MQVTSAGSLVIAILLHQACPLAVHEAVAHQQNGVLQSADFAAAATDEMFAFDM